LLTEAEACMTRALPLASQIGDRAVILNGLIYLGYMANWQGHFSQAAGSVNYCWVAFLCRRRAKAFRGCEAKWRREAAI
jgi:hypothetical protein